MYNLLTNKHKNKIWKKFLVELKHIVLVASAPPGGVHVLVFRLGHAVVHHRFLSFLRWRWWRLRGCGFRCCSGFLGWLLQTFLRGHNLDGNVNEGNIGLITNDSSQNQAKLSGVEMYYKTTVGFNLPETEVLTEALWRDTLTNAVHKPLPAKYKCTLDMRNNNKIKSSLLPVLRLFYFLK